MQLVLAILAILLYAAAYVVGGIVVGIIELVKYIKSRKKELRKAKGVEAKSINTSKKIRDDLSVIPTQIESSKGEDNSYEQNDFWIKNNDEVNVDINADEASESTGSSSSEASIVNSREELTQFNNVIYHVKLLGHDDPRFQLIAMKAYEVISRFGNSETFFADIISSFKGDNDFSSEVIRFIVVQKSQGVSDIELIRRIRNKYIASHEAPTTDHANVFHAKSRGTTEIEYIETETSPGSRQLTAKSKIAHKHKAIQYANVIGGKLLDAYSRSSESSFFEYVKKHCKAIADRGDYSITSEDFQPHKNILTTYKRSKNKTKHNTVATNIITPKHQTGDSKAETVLKILDKLTSSRLPRYEIPAYPSTDSIVQREYKKTNPFDVYNDLVSSEYTPEALKDKRFAILYQLIILIAECVENGMSEEETLSAISTLRVVKKSDLHILRNREIRLKGLSKDEREMVLDSEICNNIDMTNLYMDLIRRHKQTKQRVTLNDYIISVLLKNYKDSYTAWILLKYLSLKTNKASNKYILDNKWTILENYFISDTSQGIKDMSEIYYSLKGGFSQLKHEYDHNINMTNYNFRRDNIRTDMLNESTLKTYLPKRFDSKGRLCTLLMVSPSEAKLFKSYDIRNVGDHIYVLFPVPSFTTKDVYGLMLTVDKQKRKLAKA